MNSICTCPKPIKVAPQSQILCLICGGRVTGKSLTIRDVDPDEIERRRLFFSLMRRPDMRLMRLALRSLANDDIAWRDIREVEMLCVPSKHGSWLLRTDRFLVHCVCFEHPQLSYEDFSTYWNHVEEHGGREDSNPDCKCLDCRWQALQEVTPR